jgi:hypothetical protein
MDDLKAAAGEYAPGPGETIARFSRGSLVLAQGSTEPSLAEYGDLMRSHTWLLPEDDRWAVERDGECLRALDVFGTEALTLISPLLEFTTACLNSSVTEETDCREEISGRLERGASNRIIGLQTLLAASSPTKSCKSEIALRDFSKRQS